MSGKITSLVKDVLSEPFRLKSNSFQWNINELFHFIKNCEKYGLLMAIN